MRTPQVGEAGFDYLGQGAGAAIVGVQDPLVCDDGDVLRPASDSEYQHSGRLEGVSLDARQAGVRVRYKIAVRLVIVAGDIVVNASSGIALTANTTNATSVTAGHITVTPATLTTLATAVDISGTLFLTSIITPTSTGAEDNWNPTGLSTATVIRVNCAGPAQTEISGIVGGTSGRILILINVGTFIMHLLDEDGGSTAANQILHGQDSFEVEPHESATLWYDGTSSRWRVIAVGTSTS